MYDKKTNKQEKVKLNIQNIGRKPSSKVIINRFDITSDTYRLASQNMLGSLNFTTDTVWVIAQTNSMHKTCKTTMTGTNTV